MQACMQAITGQLAASEKNNRNKMFFYLFTEVHTSILVQLPEVRIAKVFDKSYRFSGTFHFGTQFLIHAREFIEAENRFFDRKGL